MPQKANVALPAEVRIENSLTDDKGNEVKLKEGAKVEVTVHAPPSEVIPKDKT